MLRERTTVVVRLAQQLNLRFLQIGSKAPLENGRDSLEAAKEFWRWWERGGHTIERRAGRGIVSSRTKLGAPIDHLAQHQFRTCSGEKICNAQVRNGMRGAEM